MPAIKFYPSLAAGVLLLFVLGCSAIATPAPRTPAPPHPTATDPLDNPTAGASARSTRQAAATLSAEATLSARASQTAAVLAQTAEVANRLAETANALAAIQFATSTAVAAHDIEQSALAASTTWPVRLHETFANNQFGWPVGLTQDDNLAITSTIQSGRYQWLVTVAHGNSYFNLVPVDSTALGDSYAVVSVNFVQGNDDGRNAYGLTFHHSRGNDYGFCGITKTGYLRLLEVHNTSITQEQHTQSLAFDARPGALNRLAVAALGPDYVCLINGQPEVLMSASLPSGSFGLGVDAFSRTGLAEVDFTDLSVSVPSAP